MVMIMIRVILKLNNATIGKAEMTTIKIRQAEIAGFTIIETLDK